MSSDRPFPDDVDDPGLGFQAGFGFYLGLVVTGFVAIAGVFADASTGSLLGILPSTLTAVTIAGHILAKRARGLPERIGGSRRRRLASYAPSVAFAALSFVLGPATGVASRTARLSFITIAFVLLTAVSAFGMNRLCRKRYVEAVVGDEPTVRWTATRTFPVFGGHGTLVFSIAMIAGGLALASTGNWFSLFWVLYGAAFLLGDRFEDRLEDRFDWYDSGEGWNQASTVAAYDVGLVVGDRTLLPWDAIGDVRLTDDELVVEREDARFDLRYDRSSIDDPEAVLEGIERARAGVDAPDRDRERPDLRERDAADREDEDAALGSETESRAESEPDAESGTEVETETETETESTDLETETETA